VISERTNGKSPSAVLIQRCSIIIFLDGSIELFLDENKRPFGASFLQFSIGKKSSTRRILETNIYIKIDGITR